MKEEERSFAGLKEEIGRWCTQSDKISIVTEIRNRSSTIPPAPFSELHKSESIPDGVSLLRVIWQNLGLPEIVPHFRHVTLPNSNSTQSQIQTQTKKKMMKVTMNI